MPQYPIYPIQNVTRPLDVNNMMALYERGREEHRQKKAQEAIAAANGSFEDAYRTLSASGKDNEAQLVMQIAELTRTKVLEEQTNRMGRVKDALDEASKRGRGAPPDEQRTILDGVFRNLGLDINDVPGGTNLFALATRGMTDADFHTKMMEGKADLQQTMLDRLDSQDGIDKDELTLGISDAIMFNQVPPATLKPLMDAVEALPDDADLTPEQIASIKRVVGQTPFESETLDEQHARAVQTGGDQAPSLEGIAAVAAARRAPPAPPATATAAAVRAQGAGEDPQQWIGLHEALQQAGKQPTGDDPMDYAALAEIVRTDPSQYANLTPTDRGKVLMEFGNKGWDTSVLPRDNPTRQRVMNNLVDKATYGMLTREDIEPWRGLLRPEDIQQLQTVAATGGPAAPETPTPQGADGSNGPLGWLANFFGGSEPAPGPAGPPAAGPPGAPPMTSGLQDMLAPLPSPLPGATPPGLSGLVSGPGGPGGPIPPPGGVPGLTGQPGAPMLPTLRDPSLPPTALVPAAPGAGGGAGPTPAPPAVSIAPPAAGQAQPDGLFANLSPPSSKPSPGRLDAVARQVNTVAGGGEAPVSERLVSRVAKLLPDGANAEHLISTAVKAAHAEDLVASDGTVFSLIMYATGKVNRRRRPPRSEKKRRVIAAIKAAL